MTMSKSRIYLSSPHMGGGEMKYIQEAFDTNWIAPLGNNVDMFEKETAALTEVNGALALSSGTAAMHLILRYLGVGPGDVVICSSLTFIGSCNPALYLGAELVFIDSEPESWNMSPVALEKALRHLKEQDKTPKAIIVVDLYGQSADYDAILPIAQEYGVPVIEDAAEALGSFYKGKPCGSFGDFGVLSFNGNKIITTSGGGMALSDNSEALLKMKFWATQARECERHYEHKECGYNYRLSNICAGIGRGQLEVLRDRVAQKSAIRQRYEDAFLNLPVDLMPIPAWSTPNNWLTVMTLKKSECRVNTEEIFMALDAENIEARPVWKPMHMQPLFEKCMFFSHLDVGSVSEDLFAHGVCLPSDTNMTYDKQERVVNVIWNCLNKEEA